MPTCLRMKKEPKTKPVTPTSVSLPPAIPDWIRERAEECGESSATVARQIIRCAIAGNWDAASLKLRNGYQSLDAGEDRVIFRIAFDDDMKAKIDALRGDHTLAHWFRAAAERFIQLHDWGLKSIWDLRQ